MIDGYKVGDTVWRAANWGGKPVVASAKIVHAGPKRIRIEYDHGLIGAGPAFGCVNQMSPCDVFSSRREALEALAGQLDEKISSLNRQVADLMASADEARKMAAEAGACHERGDMSSSTDHDWCSASPKCVRRDGHSGPCRTPEQVLADPRDAELAAARRVVESVRRHRRDTWGDRPVEHPCDRDLYSALSAYDAAVRG